MKSLDNHLCRIPDILSLRFIKIDRADLLLKRLRRGICIILNGSIPLEKASGNLVDRNTPYCYFIRIFPVENGGRERIRMTNDAKIRKAIASRESETVEFKSSF